MRIAYSWTCSSCSSLIGRGACSGVYSIGAPIIRWFVHRLVGLLDKRGQQLVERLDPEIVDLEGLLHIRGDLARPRLTSPVPVLAGGQDGGGVGEVRLLS